MEDYKSEYAQGGSLCELVKKEYVSSNQVSKRRIFLSDAIASVSSSWCFGSFIDCYAAGISGLGVIVNRAYMTATNFLTGGIYGYWREKVFETTKTDESSSRKRKFLSDLVAMNTLHNNIYVTGIALSTYLSEGEVNWYKVSDGVFYATAISPFLSICVNWWFDRVRKWFGIPPAAAKAYKQAKKKAVPPGDLGF